jgi:hypothetical protein
MTQDYIIFLATLVEMWFFDRKFYSLFDDVTRIAIIASASAIVTIVRQTPCSGKLPQSAACAWRSGNPYLCLPLPRAHARARARACLARLLLPQPPVPWRCMAPSFSSLHSLRSSFGTCPRGLPCRNRTLRRSGTTHQAHPASSISPHAQWYLPAGDGAGRDCPRGGGHRVRRRLPAHATPLPPDNRSVRLGG